MGCDGWLLPEDPDSGFLSFYCHRCSKPISMDWRTAHEACILPDGSLPYRIEIYGSRER